MKITLVVMTYNEIIGMRQIMPKIDPSWVDQILVVDGGSTDGTIEYCEEQGYEYYVQKNPGLRQAYMEALPLMKGDAIITFSPDGNSRPEDLPPLIKKFKDENYDMVIASRYFDGAKSEDDGMITAFGNWGFTTAINLMFGGKYTDAMTIFRIYKKSLISDLGLDQDKSYKLFEKLFNTQVSWEPLLSSRAARRKLKIGEILGFEPKRIGGERKLQVLKWGTIFMLILIRDWMFWR